MQTQASPQIVVADLTAVRDFLLTGREIPRTVRASRPTQKSTSNVQLHHGIARARGRTTSKV